MRLPSYVEISMSSHISAVFRRKAPSRRCWTPICAVVSTFLRALGRQGCDEAFAKLGFQAQDDAERFADLPAMALAEPDPIAARFQGGSFASANCNPRACRVVRPDQ